LSGHGKRDSYGISWSLGGHPFLAVVWKPEGIMLTPKSEDAEFGYGFPKRKADTGERIDGDKGTKIIEAKDAVINQVLINRFENNKYLDELDFVDGIEKDKTGKPVFELPKKNVRRRDSIYVKIKDKDFEKMTVVYWPVFFEPNDEFWEIDKNRVNWIDNPGIDFFDTRLKIKNFGKIEKNDKGEIIGDIPNRQFDNSGISLIYEIEQTGWFVHWPEELLYDTDAGEAIFKETNQYRFILNREPLHREIRGHASLARMIVSEVQRAEVMFHNDEVRFRKGYGTVENRFYAAGVNDAGGGENIIHGDYSLDTEGGIAAALGWRNSPPHYANMIDDLWKTSSTSLDVFGGPSVKLREYGIDASQGGIKIDPPQRGNIWSQLFVRRYQWLYAGTCHNRNLLGSVSTNNYFSQVLGFYYSEPSLARYVFYLGRYIYIKPIAKLEDDRGIQAFNAGSSLFDDNGVLSVRVIYFTLQSNEEDAPFVIGECHRALTGFHNDWVEGPTIEVKHLLNSMFSFSPDGLSAVSSFGECLPDKKYAWKFDDLPVDAIHAAPHGCRTIRFSDGAFSLGELVIGPDITYTFTEPFPSELPDHYNYSQVGTGSVLLYPTMDSNGDEVYYRYDMDVSLVQEWVDPEDGSYTVDLSVNDTITFPSGRKYTVANVKYDGTGSVSTMGDDHVTVHVAEFLSFAYIDPIKDDVIYFKHTATGSSPDGVYVATELFVNDVSVRSWPAKLVADDIHLEVHGPRKSSSPQAGDYVFGVPMLSMFLTWLPTVTSNRSVFPYINKTYTTQDRFYCDNSPGRYIYPMKGITGTYPASLGKRYAYIKPCRDDLIDGEWYMEHGYNVGIPFINPLLNEAFCSVARYKDRILMQADIGALWNIDSEHFPSKQERTTIYANFDLSGEIGIGELTDILPLGAIYAD